MRNGRGSATRVCLSLVALLSIFVLLAFAQKKRKDETQTLQLPRELPSVVEADPHRLAFHVTALSANGLLSKQVKDALGSLARQAKGNTVLKIRAFVAGSGDSRRVRDIVSEEFAAKHLPLPVLSLVQAGGLPENGQVVLEAISLARKDVNPHGLAFIAAQVESGADPAAPAGPLAIRSLASLRIALQAAGAEPSGVLRISCFLSSLDDLASVRKLVQTGYPWAAANFVQTQRAPIRSLAACEAVARPASSDGATPRLLNPSDLPVEAGASQIAVVAGAKVVLTGTQVSFGYEDNDARLAFQRLRKSLEQAGVSTRDVVVAQYYPLASRIANQIRQVRGEFFQADRAPASSLLLFEGLPSMNAGFAMDVVAVK